jgi:ATP-dependent Clp protease ATP-binding subunit ClpB
MAGIVDIQLRRLEKRLAARKITLDLDADAKAWLADEGYDPVFGARPLKRVIQRQCRTRWPRCCWPATCLDGRQRSPGPPGPKG